MDQSDTASSLTIYSDCDCYLCQFAMNCQDSEPYPLCNSVRHPMIYYAQCRHGKKRDCTECKRPNCFVRAFRWYTNEHGAQQERGKPCQVTEPCKDPCREDCNDDRVLCSDQPNMSAFATWLDTKYHQYLIENAAQDACRLLYTQTSVIESCHADQDDQLQSGPCGRKRFSRLKSQWKRRVQKCHERECCDRERKQPYNPSMEYILPPKNLSRVASECCHATPTCSADRHVAKSRSATATVCLNRSGYDNEEFDKPPMEQNYEKSKGKNLDKYKNACCQYTNPTSQNAQTQYEPRGASHRTSSDHSITSCSSASRVTKTSQHNHSKASSKTHTKRASDDSRHKHRPSKENNSNVVCSSKVICQCPPMSNVKISSEQKIDDELSPGKPQICAASSTQREQAQQSRFSPQVEYHETSEVQKPCPGLQQPCPSLGEATSIEPCPSLRDPCIGRRPCPSLRKICPPCPRSTLSKANAPQSQQNSEPKTNSQVQYQQSYYQSNQTQQSKLDSPTQCPNIKPTLRDCCFANSQTKSASSQKQREQGPTFVEPMPRVCEMSLKQEEVSLKSCAVNIGNNDQRSGPYNSSFREASTGTQTCSVHTQGAPPSYLNQNSAECHCSNCVQCNVIYDKTECCKRNNAVQQPNVFITTAAGEGKCSVNCPYYASVSIKGQPTQTSQTVQFSQSADSAVQTSNTAIRLDRGTILEYPLFMRVVCADKLQ